LLRWGLVFCIVVYSPKAEAGAAVAAGAASGLRGAAVAFPVTLQAVGMTGVQVDIAYDSVNTPVAAKPDGTPDCAAPAGGKPASFAFLPSGCVGAACSSIRAVVVSTGDQNPIPDGSTLFTCTVRIPSTAAIGVYVLFVQNVGITTADGLRVPVTGVNGQISVQGAGGSC
jgi:hypothetical protein